MSRSVTRRIKSFIQGSKEGNSKLLKFASEDQAKVYERRSKVIAELKVCCINEDLERGKNVHKTAIQNGDDFDIYVATTLVNLYAKCACMDEARFVFDSMEHPNVVSWTALIMGYADNRKSNLALESFSRMRYEGCEPNDRTFVAVLKVCTDLAVDEDKEEEESVKWKCIELGKVLHLLASIYGCDEHPFVGNTLVDMYAKCGSMDDAFDVFERVQERDVVSWTALILGYADNGEGLLALDMFYRMRREGCEPNARSFVSVLKSCIELAENGDKLVTSERGKSVHLLASTGGFDLDIYVECMMMGLYAKCGLMRDAERVFGMMRNRDVISWTSVILAYVDNGESSMAMDLLSKMRLENCEPDTRTFVAVLKACSNLAEKEVGNAHFVKVECREKGRILHLLASIAGCYPDHFVGNMLIDTYARCGAMEDARKVLEEQSCPDVVSWTAIIFGYAENGEGGLALECFMRMKSQGCLPNSRTFVAALKACGMMGALDYGKQLAEICSRSFKHDVVLVTCLVDFYAKCGSLSEAEELFELHSANDIATWNALIAGYSRQGDTEAVFGLFEKMQGAGVRPDGVTFLSVLTACSHANLVDKGKFYFDCMLRKYNICYGLEHYTCMIDILGRGNKLDEAMILLRNMSLSPNSVTWTTVLGACRKWKNVHLGRLAFDSLDERHSGAYLLMSNLYGSRGMWEEVAAIKSMRKKQRVWKKPGESWWTNKAGVVNTFLSGDKSHPQSQEIQEKLKNLHTKMRDHGYVADLSSVTRNISDLEKEDALCGHSEKLAIACALINTSAGETIRIIKNLRICDDCHAATALISRLEERTILCRDLTRFHIFKDGKCSCGDFW